MVTLKEDRDNETSNIIELFEEREPKIVNIESVKLDDDNFEIQSDQNYFTEKFYQDVIWDGSDYGRFIKNIEAQVRTSKEYSEYVGTYLKGELGLTRCAVLGNVEDDEGVSIEMHHYPFTLYDIVNIVVCDKIAREEKYSTFLIANEVIALHYENMVGVVPLCKTVHELVHAGKIFVNLNQVFGDVNAFIENYSRGMTPEYEKSINKLVELSKNNLKNDFDETLKVKKSNWNLQKNYELEADEF
jgi:hypothetical protein